MTEHEWLTCEDPQRMLTWLTSEGIKRVPPQTTSTGRLCSDRKLRLWCLACRRASGRGHGQNLYRIIDRTDGADGGNATNNARSWANPDFDEPGDPSPAMKCNLLRDIIGNPFRPVTVRCPVCRGDDMMDPQEDGSYYCGGCDWAGWHPWIAPQVFTLATAAYEERETAKCLRCLGSGRLEKNGSDHPCPDCRDGRILTGHLDPVRLAVLADALEEVVESVEESCPRNCWLLQGVRVYSEDGRRNSTSPTKRCDCHGGKVYRPHPLLAHLRSPGPHWRGCWAIDLLVEKE